MKIFKNKAKVKFIKTLTVDDTYNCFDAQLIHIDGLGKLKTSMNSLSDNYYGYINHIQVTLNDVPIFYAHSPGCPTCASLIATGLGIENSNCDELKAISNKINHNFINLTQSIEDLSPLLSLLSSGLYIIADMLCYPTDGNTNFFWNTPNKYTENPATCMTWLNDSDFFSEVIDGQPLYLFPTQSASKLNEMRVNEYLNIYKSNSHRPRAIAYHYDQYMNFLLDGHHKACASALIHEPVNTLVIIPLTHSYTNYKNGQSANTEFKFANFIIPEAEIPQKYRIQKNADRKSCKLKFEPKQLLNCIERECFKICVNPIYAE